MRYHFYPRSPCGERLPSVLHNFRPLQISIHALLAESDRISARYTKREVAFLSTLSLRRATLAGPSGPAFPFNFYPRSPCGERPTRSRHNPMGGHISIHALLAESDGKPPDRHDSHQPISIHALLAESDVPTPMNARGLYTFLSTLSLRRATQSPVYDHRPGNYFYPRSPCGERPQCIRSLRTSRHFYPRSPCGERHNNIELAPAGIATFLSTLSLRRATVVGGCSRLDFGHFYPRSPCGERRNIG